MPNRKHRLIFSAFLYRYRNLLERIFSTLKQFRAVVTSYNKRDDNFLALVHFASIRIWLRHNESVVQRAWHRWRPAEFQELTQGLR
ncbi:transposase [Novosphingobium chloroacetimidivorans]|uniref:Transposase n=1 Tax=Novosphingobium chloroacetimidivorans TaxID=1428314 RepID=A0A7W7KFI4_9SPHN|nr:transposase [Novosphingobium chloroacetimidivorans]MBB4861138.1 transposase [Novosphingobium chloroacetimidivorans]